MLRVQPAAMPLLVLALLCQPAFAQTPSAADVQNSPVVVITGTDAEGNTRLGTGFVIEPSGTVVTTYRTLRGLAKATVRLVNGDVHEIAHVRAIDAAKNIAIVQLRAFGLTAVVLGDSASASSDTKLIIRPASVSGPTSPVPVAVTAVERLPEGFRIMTLSPEPDPLHLGAPLLSEDGQVIALLAAKSTTTTAAPIGVPINYVRALLPLDEKLSLEELSGPAPSSPAPPVTPTAASTVSSATADDTRTASTPENAANRQKLTNAPGSMGADGYWSKMTPRGVPARILLASSFPERP